MSMYSIIYTNERVIRIYFYGGFKVELELDEKNVPKFKNSLHPTIIVYIYL